MDRRKLADIHTVLLYWQEYNNSRKYSDRLLEEILLSSTIIQKIPTIGNMTNHPNVRGKIVATHFYLFYQENETQIELLRFWDGRRTPDEIQFE